MDVSARFVGGPVELWIGRGVRMSLVEAPRQEREEPRSGGWVDWGCWAREHAMPFRVGVERGDVGWWGVCGGRGERLGWPRDVGNWSLAGR